MFLALALYFPESILFNLLSVPGINTTISLARAETLARGRATLATPRYERSHNLKDQLFNDVVGVVHTFNFMQAGREGTQGSILGFFRAGTFLETQFMAGATIFFVVTARL